MKIGSFTFALMGGLLFGGLAFAAPPQTLAVSPKITVPIPPQVLALKAAGIFPVETFPAYGGLTGWVLKTKRRYVIAYSTAKGAFLVGSLINAAGQNMTKLYAEKYIPKPDYKVEFAELLKMPAIVEPGKTRPLYVFFDPNCIFCHILFERIRPLVAQGLTIHWVPVGFMKSSSQGIDAALLSAKSPLKAWLFNENHYNKAQREGGIKPLNPVPAKYTKLFAKTGKLMGAFGGTGTPTMVWRAGGKIRVQVGVVNLSVLQQITKELAMPFK